MLKFKKGESVPAFIQHVYPATKVKSIKFGCDVLVKVTKKGVHICPASDNYKAIISLKVKKKYKKAHIVLSGGPTIFFSTLKNMLIYLKYNK